MAILEKDIKLLWGRAASRCAFPECRLKLAQDKKEVTETFPLGEQAHIVAETQKGPRGQSPLSTAERNSYFNLILLCPTHHTIIDKNVEDYPVERLHMIKDQHELWVEQTLSQVQDIRKQAHELIYSTLIDATVEHLNLADWKNWSSKAMSQPPIWNGNANISAFSFRQKIASAAKPGTIPELESALETLSIVFLEAVNFMMKHAKFEGDELRGTRFYKIEHYDLELYNKLFEEYRAWLIGCADFMFEITRSLNWLSEIVRREINPMFFAIEGKFSLEYPFDDGFRIDVPEYTSEEKASQPHLMLERINKFVSS